MILGRKCSDRLLWTAQLCCSLKVSSDFIVKISTSNFIAPACEGCKGGGGGRGNEPGRKQQGGKDSFPVPLKFPSWPMAS